MDEQNKNLKNQEVIAKLQKSLESIEDYLYYSEPGPKTEKELIKQEDKIRAILCRHAFKAFLKEIYKD